MDLQNDARKYFSEAVKQQPQTANYKLFNPGNNPSVTGFFIGEGEPIVTHLGTMKTFLIKEKSSDDIWLLPGWQVLCNGHDNDQEKFFLGFDNEIPGDEFEYFIKYNGKGANGFHDVTVWKKKTAITETEFQSQ